MRLLRDNIDLVIRSSDAVLERFLFVRDLDKLPNVKTAESKYIQSRPALSQKYEEVSDAAQSAIAAHRFESLTTCVLPID